MVLCKCFFYSDLCILLSRNRQNFMNNKGLIENHFRQSCLPLISLIIFDESKNSGAPHFSNAPSWNLSCNTFYGPGVSLTKPVILNGLGYLIRTGKFETFSISVYNGASWICGRKISLNSCCRHSVSLWRYVCYYCRGYRCNTSQMENCMIYQKIGQKSPKNQPKHWL